MVILVVAVGAFVVMAAFTDCCMHRIPNYITVPTAIVGLAYNTVAPTAVGPWMSLAGFAVGFSLLFIPWLLGGAGMGDVKLLAALGAWLGPWWLLAAFACSTLIACAIALSVLVSSAIRKGLSRAKEEFSRGIKHETGAGRPSRRVIPFAVPVAVGTWVVLVWRVCKGT